MRYFFTVVFQQLVGGFNPFEKYARQSRPFPQVGLKIKEVTNHHLDKFASTDAYLHTHPGSLFELCWFFV